MRIPFLMLLVVAGCTADRRAAPPLQEQEHPGRIVGDVVDSILPMSEYLDRFREGTTEATTLSGKFRSKDSLAAQVLSAIAAHDSVGLAALVVTRAEFGWLIFPAHRYSRPPYELDPAIFWMQVQSASAPGIAQVLARYGGTRLTFRSLRCDADTVQAIGRDVAMWSRCVTDFEVDGQRASARLFGTIVERDGVMKLLGYANEL